MWRRKKAILDTSSRDLSFRVLDVLPVLWWRLVMTGPFQLFRKVLGASSKIKGAAGRDDVRNCVCIGLEVPIQIRKVVPPWIYLFLIFILTEDRLDHLTVDGQLLPSNFPHFSSPVERNLVAHNRKLNPIRPKSTIYPIPCPHYDFTPQSPSEFASIVVIEFIILNDMVSLQEFRPSGCTK